MFARTERLLLRPGWADDAPALTDAIAHPQVAQMLTQVPWPYGVDDAVQFLEAPQQPDTPRALIFLRTAGKPRLIGGIGLNTADSGTELGFWISPAYWGLGFATEAGRAVVSMARHTLRLPRLGAAHFIDNPASGHVLRKLGFARTGHAVPRASKARQGEVLAVTYQLDLTQAEDVVDNRMCAAPLLAA
ncbi:MAG: GNAT family N-acetyltransferase [Alphaproteobacteria bacterium]|jgi:RimJ/RimL family protein N-acetyltransferase|nr:GNAT family N-acetyltransferase [Alphaproteobacteria bacterium]